MKENEKISFFQKWYSESSKNLFHFYHFLKPHWHRFRLKNYFWYTMALVLLLKLLYRVIALQQSNSECLKWYQSSFLGVQSQNTQFLQFLSSRRRFENLPICWILVNFLTSSASRKFFMHQKHTYLIVGNKCSPLFQGNYLQNPRGDTYFPHFINSFQIQSKGLYKYRNDSRNHPEWLFQSSEICLRHIRNHPTNENYFLRLHFRKPPPENE